MALVFASALLLPALAAAQSSGQGGLGGARQGSLQNVPLPVVENFEASVQEQLRAAYDRVAQILERENRSEARGDALGQLGALYLLYDFMDTAKPLLLQARELQPGDFRWPHFLSLLYQFEGDAAAGLENARRACELKPDFLAAHLRRGDFALELGELQEAREAYRKALELGDPSGAALYGLGRLDLEANQPRAAIEKFEQALATQPPGSVIHYHLGVAYRQLGDRQRARAEFAANQRERVLFPDVLYDTLSSLNRSREAVFSQGVDALRRGQVEQALEIFGELVEANPDDAEAHYNVGMALIEQGRKDAAEQAIRKAIELRPDYRDAHYNLGLVLGQRGAHAESEAAFRRVLEIDAEDLTSRVALANAVAEQGRESEAIDLLHAALEVDPALAEARLLLGIVHARTGNAEAAQRELGEILALAPGAATQRAEAHYHLALLGPPAVSEAEALGHLLAASELGVAAASLRAALAAELGRRGEFAAAARVFEQVVEAKPGDVRARLSLAMAHLLGGAEMAARQALEESLLQLREEIVLQHLLARLLATASSPAVRDGERALELALGVMQRQQTLEHGETLAMALAEIGRFDDAVRWQEQVLARARQAGESTQQREARLALYRARQPVRTPWREVP